VNGLGDVLGLGDTLDQLGNELLNILVDDQATDGLHGLESAGGNVLLGDPHGLRDGGDQLGDTGGHLSLGDLDEGVEEVQSQQTLRELLGVAEGLEDSGQSSLDSVGVDGLSDGQTGSDGGSLDAGDLVTGTSQDGGQELNQERLNVGGNLGVLGNGLDGSQSLLADSGILLVVQLLGKSLEGPELLVSF
jgi:hypothetical protein